MTAAQREVARPLGLVPTMGALHEGHLSLVHRAREENATAAASIFVNPTQFGPNEDYRSYPRDLDRDLALLEERGVDLVFLPEPDDMYPAGFDTWVDVDRIASRLEGESRPGHFRGVATVVTKLFTIVRPDRAYFGQKDAQQAQVIRRINADLNLGVEPVVMPTVREADGLAMSSRNAYLNPQEREAALVLYRSLCLAREMYNNGVASASRIRDAMTRAHPRRAAGPARIRQHCQPRNAGGVGYCAGSRAGVPGREDRTGASDRQRDTGRRRVVGIAHPIPARVQSTSASPIVTPQPIVVLLIMQGEMVLGKLARLEAASEFGANCTIQAEMNTPANRT